MHRSVTAVCALSLSLAVVLLGCSNNGGEAQVITPASPTLAPALAMQSIDGKRISIADFRGKVVVVDFWASWCPPCREGLPHIQNLSSNADFRARGLVVLAVNEQENAADIRRFIDQSHYTFTVLSDPDGSAARAYSAISLPTTVVIGRDGTIRLIVTGCTPATADRLDQEIARLLQRSADQNS